MNLPDAADARKLQLERWLAGRLGAGLRLEPASEDASFRRYFRVSGRGGTTIAMDAPPDREDLGPYLQVATLLAATGVNVPQVLERDLDQGFLLLNDLGSEHFLAALARGMDPLPLYADALQALVRFQSQGSVAALSLPRYDAAMLRRELALFPEWFLDRHLGIGPDAAELQLLESVNQLLCDQALAQPQVLVHRDYHSRNLMVCPGNNPGILDFQDAVSGAVSYDLVSLLKDCYVIWPSERVAAWITDYRRLAAAAGVDTGPSLEAFTGWFHLTGLQRHLKVLGIFARLWHRDGKRGYLADLPRVFDYVLAVTGAQPALGDFDAYLRRKVRPVFDATRAERRTAR